jgi:hypothetical protein
MAKEAMAGTESGRTNRVNVVRGEAPSTRADSMISSGREEIAPLR